VADKGKRSEVGSVQDVAKPACTFVPRQVSVTTASPSRLAAHRWRQTLGLDWRSSLRVSTRPKTIAREWRVPSGVTSRSVTAWRSSQLATAITLPWRSTTWMDRAEETGPGADERKPGAVVVTLAEGDQGDHVCAGGVGELPHPVHRHGARHQRGVGVPVQAAAVALQREAHRLGPTEHGAAERARLPGRRGGARARLADPHLGCVGRRATPLEGRRATAGASGVATAGPHRTGDGGRRARRPPAREAQQGWRSSYS